MALQTLSPSDLADTQTVFASFMGRTDAGYRTVAELLEIYRERASRLVRAEDWGDHLRVDRFIDDMAAEGWSEDVVVRIGVFDDTVLVIDGIHRSIAYLACLEQGISPDRLPALQVDR